MTPTPTRRAVISAMAIGAAGCALPARGLPRHGFSWPLGVQLWSVDRELGDDVEGVFHQLAALGFREAETAGLHGRDPVAFRAAATRAGLSLVSAHYSMPDLFDDAASHIAEAQALGVRWLVVSSPRADRPLKSGDWIGAIHDAMTLPAWRENAARLDTLGRSVHAAGMQLAYHNHPIEFDRFDGQRGFDVLMAGTDPAFVKLELDIAWAVAGGADPIALLRRHRDRIRLIHIKGLKAKPQPGAYGTDFSTGIVGQGDVIDWPGILSAARRAGVRHAFIEQEPPHVRPIMQSLAACRDYLRTV